MMGCPAPGPGVTFPIGPSLHSCPAPCVPAWSRLLRTGLLLWCLGGLGACAVGPRNLAEERLRYNEVIKATTEQQMLLNIVRLRYADTPSSLAVSSVATQYELLNSIGIVPFYGLVGNEAGAVGRASVLPSLSSSITERPTVTLTPLDDQEFTRKLFTPMSLEGVLYLARTTWPIATVFRLWLENLNWVSNAETGSGPTALDPPDFARFLAGVEALQSLQDRGLVVFATTERPEAVGGTLPEARITARAMVEAAKEDMRYERGADGRWGLVRTQVRPILRIHPKALNSPEMAAFTHAFRLRSGLPDYEIHIGELNPFPDTYPTEGVKVLDLETRSLLQVLYFLSKGVEVPPEHAAAQLTRVTREADGRPFDWHRVTQGLFRVMSRPAGQAPPPSAHVAVRYLDRWFYIDKADHDSMSTFSLVLQLSRLELVGKTGPGPTLTLPLSGR